MCQAHDLELWSSESLIDGFNSQSGGTEWIGKLTEIFDESFSMGIEISQKSMVFRRPEIIFS